MVAATDL